MATIDLISGGNFTGTLDSGLYFSTKSAIKMISGDVTATGKYAGVWNGGSIDSISNGNFIGSGEDSSGLINICIT